MIYAHNITFSACAKSAEVDTSSANNVVPRPLDGIEIWKCHHVNNVWMFLRYQNFVTLMDAVM